MAKKDMPAAKSATASGTGAQGVQGQDGGAASETSGASTPGQEAGSKADLIDTIGSTSNDAGAARDGDQLLESAVDSLGKALDEILPLSATVPGLLVVARYDGFRRAGIVWGKKLMTVRLDDLTAAQIALLENEPALSVRYCDIPDYSEGWNT